MIDFIEHLEAKAVNILSEVHQDIRRQYNENIEAFIPVEWSTKMAGIVEKSKELNKAINSLYPDYTPEFITIFYPGITEECLRKAFLEYFIHKLNSKFPYTMVTIIEKDSLFLGLEENHYIELFNSRMSSLLEDMYNFAKIPYDKRAVKFIPLEKQE